MSEKTENLTGIEALAYLIEEPGKRFVTTSTNSDIYRMSGHHLEFQSIANPNEWFATTWAIGRWLEFTYSIVPDPSKPKEVELGEYEKDRVRVVEASLYLALEDERSNMICFIEKHFQRKP